MHTIHFPTWARRDAAAVLGYLVQIGGLQFSSKGGINIWAKKSGVSPRTIYTSISRGHFSSAVAKRLVAALDGNVIRLEWLISPESIDYDGGDIDG